MQYELLQLLAARSLLTVKDSPEQLSEGVKTFIDLWIKQVNRGDLKLLVKMLADGSVYKDPQVSWSPEEYAFPKELVKKVLDLLVLDSDCRFVDPSIVETVLERVIPLSGDSNNGFLGKSQKDHLRKLLEAFKNRVPTPSAMVYLATSKGLEIESEKVQYLLYLLQIIWDICDKGLAFEAVRPTFVDPVCGDRVTDDVFKNAWKRVVNQLYRYQTNRTAAVAPSTIRRGFVLEWLLSRISTTEEMTSMTQALFSSDRFNGITEDQKKFIFDEVNTFGDHMSIKEWWVWVHINSLFGTIYTGASHYGSVQPVGGQFQRLPHRGIPTSLSSSAQFEQMKALFLLRLIIHAMEDAQKARWMEALNTGKVALSPEEQNLLERLKNANTRKVSDQSKRTRIQEKAASDMEDILAFRKTGPMMKSLIQRVKEYKGPDGYVTIHQKDSHPLTPRGKLIAALVFFNEERPGGNPKPYLNFLLDFLLTFLSSKNEEEETRKKVSDAITLFKRILLKGRKGDQDRVLNMNHSVFYRVDSDSDSDSESKDSDSVPGLKMKEAWKEVGTLFSPFGDFTDFNNSMKELRSLDTCHNKAKNEVFYALKIVLEELLKSPAVFKAVIDLQVVG